MADPGEGPRGPAPSPIFRPNWGQKGQKIFFWRLPPLISGCGWPLPPLPHLKVWICQCHQHYHYHDRPTIDLVTNVHDKPWSSPISWDSLLLSWSFHLPSFQAWFLSSKLFFLSLVPLKCTNFLVFPLADDWVEMIWFLWSPFLDIVSCQGVKNVVLFSL